MRFHTLLRAVRIRSTSHETSAPLLVRYIQADAANNRNLKKYKYPPIYDPYGPKPPPSEKVAKLADIIAALSPDERAQIGPALGEKLKHPKLEPISTEGLDLGPAMAGPGAAQVEEKVEKTAFDVKLEKFEAASKIKVIKEVRAFTNLGLKEAKELVEKAPVLLKQGVTKDEAAEIIEKIKAVGGVATDVSSR
ncbi:hypothetical protein V2J09_020260 [Rumex salicifolius]